METNSLYDISKDLLAIFNQIEEQDGEITEEQLKQLEITKDNLNNKLDAYHKAILSFKANSDECKAEVKRLRERQEMFSNRVDRLKDIVLNAVELFGNINKNGTKFIETATYRFSERNSKQCIINEERVNILIIAIERFIRELANAGVLYVGEDTDFKGILDSLNANCKAEYDEDFQPFTMQDLCNLKLKISIEDTIYNLFTKKYHFLEAYGITPTSTLESAISKSEIKSNLEIDINNTITIATLQNNKSLNVK